MITGHFSKEQRDEVAKLLDNMKASVLEAIDRGQILRVSQEVESRPIRSGDGMLIDYVYTGNFHWSIGTGGFLAKAVPAELRRQDDQAQWEAFKAGVFRSYMAIPSDVAINVPSDASRAIAKQLAEEYRTKLANAFVKAELPNNGICTHSRVDMATNRCMDCGAEGILTIHINEAQ